MKIIFPVLIAFLFFTPILAQSISGRVVNAITKEPLAFANFTFNGNQRMSTSSDIDGKFSFTSSEKLTSAICSYVGYQTQTILLQNEKNIIVYLKSS